MDWRGASPVQKQFMHSVYQGHVYRSAQRGTFVGDVASSRLARIEKQHQAQIEAAKACQELLKAARADLAQQKPEQAIQLDIEYVSIISAYRSASQQFFKWQTNFPSYYRQTRPQRSAVPGGEHGTAAVQFMIQYIGRRLAAPGYSLHNSGLAVDFGTKEGGRNLTPDTSSANVRHWRGSWLFHWLSANASRFGYYQNTSIDEPWHWEYEKVTR
ncbi:MAG: D-alanyl-D-alanine carboxypeptidase family protein [Gemmatimonadaceae bacterium]|nr:D-alanyl-D-alanine carboxypeptidase family protein [Gloeobacterales cyanobacterium ES-bin-141]